jgi:hypothetical protein
MTRTADSLRDAAKATGLVEGAVIDDAKKSAMRERQSAVVCRPMALPSIKRT